MLSIGDNDDPNPWRKAPHVIANATAVAMSATSGSANASTSAGTNKVVEPEMKAALRSIQSDRATDPSVSPVVPCEICTAQQPYTRS